MFPTGVPNQRSIQSLTDRETIALEWCKAIPAELSLAEAERILRVSEGQVDVSALESDPALYVMRHTVNDLKTAEDREIGRFTIARLWDSYNRLLDAQAIAQGYTWVIEFAPNTSSPAIRRADLYVADAQTVIDWAAEHRFFVKSSPSSFNRVVQVKLLTDQKPDDEPIVLGKLIDGSFARARKLK